MTKPQPLFTSKQVWQIPDTQLEASVNQYGEVEVRDGDKLILTLPGKKAQGLGNVLTEASKNCTVRKRKPKAETVTVEFKDNAAEVLSAKLAKIKPADIGPVGEVLQQKQAAAEDTKP